MKVVPAYTTTFRVYLRYSCRHCFTFACVLGLALANNIESLKAIESTLPART